MSAMFFFYSKLSFGHFMFSFFILFFFYLISNLIPSLYFLSFILFFFCASFFPFAISLFLPCCFTVIFASCCYLQLVFIFSFIFFLFLIYFFFYLYLFFVCGLFLFINFFCFVFLPSSISSQYLFFPLILLTASLLFFFLPQF